MVGEVKGTETIEGITVPTKMDVSWVLDGEVFTWYKINISEIEHNGAEAKYL